MNILFIKHFFCRICGSEIPRVSVFCYFPLLLTLSLFPMQCLTYSHLVTFFEYCVLLLLQYIFHHV